MFYAEREGFEPPERCRSTVFKTAVIDHSTTSPICNPPKQSSFHKNITPFPKGTAKIEKKIIGTKKCSGQGPEQLLDFKYLIKFPVTITNS